MALRIVEMPSPNFDPRAPGSRIDILVLHYTGMKTADEALRRLCDPQAKVSSHYTIDRDGTIYRHVPEELRARHAGVSWWAGVRDVNSHSIGIELVNPGHEFGYIPFAQDQIAALIDLCRGIFARHRIAPARVVGHSDVAPDRKEDPGELFPWQRLAEFGIGVWPPTASRAASAAERSDSVSSPVYGGGGSALAAASDETEGGSFAAKLSRFGYGTPPDVDWPLEKTIAAFQRHFRPACINGIADAECAALLEGLLAA